MRRSASLAAFVAVLTLCLTAAGKSPASARAPRLLPDNVIAAVSDVPPKLGRVTSGEFHRALAQAAAPRRTPRPGSARYEHVEHVAIESSLELIWIQGQAAEMGIRASAGEVSREVAKIKRQSFDGHADYRRFLKRFHYTPRDVNERVKVQILSTRIQERLLSRVEYPGQEEQVLHEFVAAYRKRWRARTICAPGHVVVDRCSSA
jgi:hypothetical protein